MEEFIARYRSLVTGDYRLTSKGLLLTAALQATRRATIKDLLETA